MSPILASLCLGTKMPANVYAMTMRISSRIAMNARTRTLPLNSENVEIVEKYARRAKRMRTPRSGKATITANRTRFSLEGRVLISPALLAVRRKRQM